MASNRITLGTYSQSGTVVNSFNEGEYVDGGLAAAIEDAQVSAEDRHGYWSRNGGVRETGVCVAVFPVSSSAPMRIVARFPFWPSSLLATTVAGRDDGQRPEKER